VSVPSGANLQQKGRYLFKVPNNLEMEEQIMKRFYMLIGVVAVVFLAITVISPATCGAAAAKPITLKFSYHMPQDSFPGLQYQWWANEVEKRTNGQYKVQIYWMQSLAKQTDALPAMQSGLCDITFVSANYFVSNFPLFIVLDMPGNGGQDYLAPVQALTDSVDHQPALKAELEKQKMELMIPYTSGLMQLAFKTRPEGLKDLKGKTIRSVGTGVSKYLQNLGANPVFMSYNDIYEAIDRGTIVGSSISVMLSDALKHSEVMKGVLMGNYAVSLAVGVYMNKDVYNKLPADVQKILMDLRTEGGIRFVTATKDFEAKIYRNWMDDGVSIIPLNGEDRKINEKAIKDAREFLLDDYAKKTPEVRNVWDYYSKAITKYEAANAAAAGKAKK
jgi:TRAP-type C4-dicarboxylate transport system substrate-binding protein